MSRLSDAERLGVEVRGISQALHLKLEMQTRPLGSCVLGSNYAGAHYRGAFVVGDACEIFDPVGGMGMTHAILSGRLAAQSVARAVGGSQLSCECRAYERNRYESARVFRGFTRATKLALTTSIGSSMMPFFVRTGMASRMASAVHAEGASSGWANFLSLFGAGAGFCRD